MMHICLNRPEGGCMLNALYSVVLKAAALVHLKISFICSCEHSNAGCGCLCIMNIQNKCQMTRCICSSFPSFFASSLPHMPKKREIVEIHCLPKCKLLETSHGHLAVLSFVCFGYKDRSYCKLIL